MITYTIIAHVVADGGYCVLESAGVNATDAAVRLREELGLRRDEFQVVAVLRGPVAFILPDEQRVALAKHSVFAV
jgi:hypothetical protein